MSNAYVIISNTGSTAGGGKIYIDADTWQPNQVAPESGRGLNGDAYQNIGARMGKWEWDFTALAYKTGATGFANLDVGSTSILTLATSTSAALRALTLQDVDGTVFNVQWESAYKPVALTKGINGVSELYRIAVHLAER